MSSNDDDTLDLSAWQAPLAPDGIADAVIDRMGGTDVSVTIPVDPRESPRRRLWVIGGVAAAVVVGAVGIYALVRSAQPAAPRSGAVVAAKPQTLSLDGVTATLDDGADVRWKRASDGLYVEQRAGVAMWRVGSDDKLVIDAGGEGLRAPIEAQAANLRVEVQMNAMDAKIIGASALTAAAVAAITIVVYEGAVKVRDRGNTVIVQPGSTYKVVPPADDRQDLVAVAPRAPRGDAEVRIAAGESPTLHIDSETVTVELDGSSQCPHGIELQLDGARSDKTITLSVGQSEYITRCTNDSAIAARGTLLVVKDTGTSPELQLDIIRWNDEIELRGVALPGAKASINNVDATLDRKGRFLVKLPAPANDALAVRVVHPTRGIHYYIRHAVKTVADKRPSCDADGFKDKGMRNINMGQHAAALSQFEASLRCKDDPYVRQLAFMEACSSGNSPKARYYYKLLTPNQQQKFQQICVRQKVAYDDQSALRSATSPCDADALKDKGMEMITIGKHAAALAQFEASLRCKDDSYIRQLAFMSACSSQNEAKAREYYVKLTPTQQTKFAQVCIRNNVRYTGPAAMGELQLQTSPPAMKILIDGTDTGRVTPATLSVTAGKHKVTFVVGDDRFTYAVNVLEGDKTKLTKELW